MATSNSVDFNLTRNEIIQDAFSLIGVYTEGQGIQPFDQVRAERALNRMIKHWSTKGLNLWKKEQGYLFLTADQESYTISTSTTDHVTGSYVQTALNGGEPISETIMVIDSSSGMTANDYVGIELSDGTMHWDTISVVNSATQITLTTGLAGAASDNAVVFAYTSKLTAPLRILDAYFRNKNGYEHQISVIENTEYYRIPDKDSTGKANQVYYDKRRTTGILYVWPVADNVTDVIFFTHEQPMDDFDSANDNADVPVEWLDALVYNLASRLSFEYSMDVNKQMILKQQAAELLDDLLAWDKEDEVQFQPNFNGDIDA